MPTISYELRTRQQTGLTPRQQQSVKLLHMSTLDCEHEIAESIENNPFLQDSEEIASDAESGSAENRARDALSAPVTGMPPASAPDYGQTGEQASSTRHEASGEAEVNSSFSGDYPISRGNDRPDADVGQWARQDAGLGEILRADLAGYSLSDRDHCLVEYIIDALDEDGYLRVAFRDLASPGQFSPPVDDSEWEAALRLVQHLHACGLGARNLEECLTLQLQALPEDTPCKALALRVVAEALDKIGAGGNASVARLLDCPEHQAEKACALIRTLSPRPAQGFARIDASCHVIPDAIVRKAGKSWIAVSNDDALPRVSLNRTYAELFRGARSADRSLMAQALREARWLLQSLEQRSSTIHRVAQAIVARQQTFFDYGEIALKPMMLSEIADELGLHESTISRATSNKYLQSPRGMHEFKHFFSQKMATKSGGSCSAAAVRARIREMIAAEDSQAPLSDAALGSRLVGEGIVVARRTVSKYRKQLGYSPAKERQAC